MSKLIGLYYMDKYENLKSKLRHLKKDINVPNASFMECWSHENLGVVRVHHGVINSEEQPIFNEDGTKCIFMIGEVFGYHNEKKNLIQKGHKFKFDNDAEYCLHLFEEYGEGSFIKLNGSFNLIIYDFFEKKLIIVNDRFAYKPMFFCKKDNLVAFSSRIKPLLNFSDKKYNMSAIYDFFGFQKIFGDKTYYKDIYSLGNAEYLIIDHKGYITKRKYWEISHNIVHRSEDEYVKILSGKLVKAMERRTSDKNKKGILLSGGLDSRAILAGDHKNKIKYGFTIGDFYNKEVEISNKVADSQDMEFYFLQRNKEYYINILEKAVEIGEGMYRFDHAHFLNYTNKLKSNVDVVFTGGLIEQLWQGSKFFYYNLQNKIKTPYLLDTNSDILEFIIYKYGVKLNNYEVFKGFNKLEFQDNLEKSLADIFSENINVNLATDFIFYNNRNPAYLNQLCLDEYIDHRLLDDTELIDFLLTVPVEFRANGHILRKSLKYLSKELTRIPTSNYGMPVYCNPYFEFLVSIFYKSYHKLKLKRYNKYYTNHSWPNRGQLLRDNKKFQMSVYNTITKLDDELFDKKTLKNLFHDHINYKKNNYEILALLLTFGKWQEMTNN